MAIDSSKLPIGQKVMLPGHFDQAVILEGVRLLGKGFECRVRLPDGSLDETVISEEEANILVGNISNETSTTTHASAAESAFVKLYPEVWLPKLDQGAITVEKIAVGGRPLQTTLNEKHQAMIYERIMELITQVQKRVFSTLKAAKLVESFKLGQGTPSSSGMKCADIVSGYYSFLGFTRLLSDDAIRKGIAEGVKEGRFGYFTGTEPALDASGKYQVARNKVRFEVSIADDEIDLESGFVMLPQAIPAELQAIVPGAAVSAVPASTAETPPPGPTPLPVPGTIPPVSQKVVELSFRANRDQLYQVYPALANLADMAGQVAVIVRAESDKGFDKSKLQNGVIEPLKEANLME